MQKVLVGNPREYKEFLEQLAPLDYHWLSGQIANEAPFFLKPNLSPEHEDSAIMLVLFSDDKKLGYIPMEVLSKQERISIINEAISVPEFLQAFGQETEQEFLEDIAETMESERMEAAKEISEDDSFDLD